MSENIPTSSRLDSLSRRSGSTTATAKPGLKFKPKVVARRTKEERDADAPVTVQMPSFASVMGHGNSRGGRGGARGGMRGGRGGRAMAGTHVVQAGPLASGNASLGGGSQRLANRSGSPTPDYLNSLIKRDQSGSSSSRGGSRGASVGLDSDDDDENLAKINMNEEYKFSDSETELFPVRAPRAKLESNVKREVIDLSNGSSSTTSREQSPDVDAMDVDVSVVKDEPTDENLADALLQKDLKLQAKLNELQIKNEALTLGTEEAIESTQRMNDDHRGIVETIHKNNNKPEKFMLFQLPRVLPTFGDDEEEKLGKKKSKSTEVKDEKDLDLQMDHHHLSGFEGEFAKLRIHKSGKLSMKIGNVIMDVSKGSAADLLQEVVLMKKEGDNARSVLLGHLQEKVVVTPNFS